MKTCYWLILTFFSHIALSDTRCDAERGKKLYRKCAICHSLDPSAPQGAGPNLHAIMGKNVASGSDFSFSQALEEKGGTWNDESLEVFLKNPMKDVPGTVMAFAGFKKEEDRKQIICHLRSASGQ
ncbi:MAG: c-type cytochrome [Gammaproteobacteria bacterium]|nr:c-type cytochrome [Gammaproteobacteria bacterium]